MSRLICLSIPLQDGEAERIREQISTLQHDIETTRGELVMAVSTVTEINIFILWLMYVMKSL